MAESNNVDILLAQRARYLKEEAELVVRAKQLRSAIDGITAVLTLEGVSPIDPSGSPIELAVNHQTVASGLTPAIKSTIKGFSKPFTAPQVLKELMASYPTLVSTDRAASVSSALRRLAAEKFIDISAKGAGRRATKYRLKVNGHNGKEVK